MSRARSTYGLPGSSRGRPGGVGASIQKELMVEIADDPICKSESRDVYCMRSLKKTTGFSAVNVPGSSHQHHHQPLLPQHADAWLVCSLPLSPPICLTTQQGRATVVQGEHRQGPRPVTSGPATSQAGTGRGRVDRQNAAEERLC